MALCFEGGVAEIWQVLRKSSACWLVLLAVLWMGPWALLGCGRCWGAPTSAVLQGCTSGMPGTAAKCTLQQNYWWYWLTVSNQKLFSISHCGSDVQALADHIDMSKTCLSVQLHVLLIANISQTLESGSGFRYHLRNQLIGGNSLLSKGQEKRELCCKLKNQCREDLLYLSLGKPWFGAQSRMRHRPIGSLSLLFPRLRELLVSYVIQIALQIWRQIWQQQ